MADMFKPHTEGCKVCKQVVHQRYGPDIKVPEHDQEDVRYTHDYARPTPLDDILEAAFGDPTYRFDGGTFRERNSGSEYRFKFGGIIIRPWAGATRQFPLNKDGALDLDKIRAAIVETERNYADRLAESQKRNEMYDASRRVVNRLQERIGDRYHQVGITTGTSPSIVNLELRGLTEERAITVLRAAGYLIDVVEETPAEA